MYFEPNIDLNNKVKQIIITQREREPVLRRLRATPLGLCLSVIVNETHIILEKKSFGGKYKDLLILTSFIDELVNLLSD